MENKLNSGRYRTMEDFEADMHLIFQNCRQFNHPATIVVANANVLEGVFDKEWVKAMEKKLAGPDKNFALKTLQSLLYDPSSVVIFHSTRQ